MAEIYFQAKEGKVKLADMLTLKKDEKVTGSGILTQHFSTEGFFSLRDAVHLMIVYSDNTATNMVLEKLGPTKRHQGGQRADGEARSERDADQRQGLQGQHDVRRPGPHQEVRPRLDHG